MRDEMLAYGDQKGGLACRMNYTYVFFCVQGLSVISN